MLGITLSIYSSDHCQYMPFLWGLVNIKSKTRSPGPPSTGCNLPSRTCVVQLSASVWFSFPLGLCVIQGYFSSFSCFYGFTSFFYCYSCPFSSHHISCCLSSSVGPHPTHTLSGLRLILVSRENNLGPNNPNPQGAHGKILETKYPKVFLLLILS